jgi:hypothetical protein
MGAGEAPFASAPFAAAARPLTPLRLTALPPPPSAEYFGCFGCQLMGIFNCR